MVSASRASAPSATPGASPTSLRQRLAAMRHLPALLRLVWETSPLLAAALIVLRVLRAFVPVAVMWIGKLIIDGVLAARADGAPWQSLLGLLGIEIGVVLVGEWMARGSSLIEGLLGERFSNRVSVQLMEHAATLDLAQFEDAEFYDSLERARRQTTARIGLVAMLLQTAQSALTLLTLGAALLAFSPLLVLLLVVAVLPGFLSETRFAAMEYSMLWRRTPERRRLDYMRYVAASSPTAKEVQLFGLADWLIARFRRLADRWYEENRRLSQRKALVGSALVVLSTLGYYIAYAFIIARTVQGAITLGSLTFLAASFARGRDLVQSILGSASSIYEQSLYLRDLFVFFDRTATITSLPGAPPVPDTLHDGFVFDRVGFRYPGSEQWAVRDVSFRIHPGERLALVGENGAGKTTITKLLARLYDPTEGRVLLDGRDLREYDLASVRRSIGVIFQDFVRYDLRFDENIAIGGIDEMRDYLAGVEGDDAHESTAGAAAASPDRADEHDVPVAIRSAAERSLAAALLPRLPAGYGQMLGRRFDGGVDLSGGEWQKVALARAWMRDAHLLILDEPTAALDARAEYEVFVRFSEFVAGRMAVLISHRFSTVRMADRILVLTGGQLVEEGSHDDLVAAGGLYAELFHMQAAGYR